MVASTGIEPERGSSQRPSSAVAPPAPEPGQSSGIARAAGINSLGNVASRVLGLVREAVVAGIFGASGETSAFDAVSGVPKMVYELLVGGMLSAALVPVLSEYSAERRQTELERILSILLSLGGAVLLVVVVFLELGARWIAPLLVGGFDAHLLGTATLLVRIIVPSILIYGLSGIIQAYHYARKRFVYPAVGAPAHNLGVIIAVALLASKLHIASLSVAVLAASGAQLVAQLPGLRGTHLAVCFDWHHPVVRRILKLYAPVVLSIIVANIGIVIDRNLASRTVNEAITWMSKATFLIQLPLGLISMAISLAVLPTLSRIDARQDVDAFKRTLCLGLRLVLVLIIPAGALLLALGNQLIALAYERGAFTPADTAATWGAVRYYLPGLIFAAIDLPLVFAFYAQKDTVTPVIVGIVTVLLYVVVAPTLAFVAGWGFLGLVAANSVQLASHAVLMVVLFIRRFHGLGGYGVLRTTLKASGASLLVLLASYSSIIGLARTGLSLSGVGRAASVMISVVLGILGFVVGAQLLRLEEVALLRAALSRRLRVGGT